MWLISHNPKSKRASSAYGPREHHHPTGNVTTIGIGRREFIATLGRYLCSVGVPMQHSQLFFSIKSHVDDVRARLAARLVQTRSQIVKVA
jgi:hypothetical protein